MQTLQIITLVVFAIEAIGIGVGLLATEGLFQALEKNHPKYYRQIGQPTALRLIAFPNSPDISRRLRSNAFMLSLASKGIPADFPKDSKLQKIANLITIRCTGITLY